MFLDFSFSSALQDYKNKKIYKCVLQLLVLEDSSIPNIILFCSMIINSQFLKGNLYPLICNCKLS